MKSLFAKRVESTPTIKRVLRHIGVVDLTRFANKLFKYNQNIHNFASLVKNVTIIILAFKNVIIIMLAFQKCTIVYSCAFVI